jgi:hypothetical protein
MPNKKNKFEIFFGYIWTMINVLIIFFTQYFQEKLSDPTIRISFFNQSIQGWIIFSKFIFLHEWNG